VYVANGTHHVHTSGLLELLKIRLPMFADLPDRHQRHIARMLWDYANNRYQHIRHDGAAFSVKYMRALWGNLETRNKVVHDFFTNIQGDNHSHLISCFTPYDFLGQVLVDYLEDETPVDFLDGDKMMRMPPSPIRSRAARNNSDVTHAKHSKWKGVWPSPTIPINQGALLDFSRKTTNPRQKMGALRLLKLSRNTRCPGQIPVVYEQKSTGRLTDVLFAVQNTHREVISAALHGYWDYDLNNAHFSILSAWAKRLGQSTPVVDQYLRHRRKIRIELAENCNAELDDVKECLIALLYGGPLQINPDFATIPKILGRDGAILFKSHPFVIGLKNEISRVAKFIVADTHSTRGCYVNAMGIEAKKITKKDPTFNLLCHALQGVEALALKTVVTQHGEDILLCMHDGWVSRRRLDLKKLKRIIYAATSFELEIEEQRLPKYHAATEGLFAWNFSDSAEADGGFVVSLASDWNTSKNTTGRWSRTDLSRVKK
jgi:hypothetical protein